MLAKAALQQLKHVLELTAVTPLCSFWTFIRDVGETSSISLPGEHHCHEKSRRNLSAIRNSSGIKIDQPGLHQLEAAIH